METDVAEHHRVRLLHALHALHALHDARGQRLARGGDRVARRHPALHGRLPVAVSRTVLVQVGFRAALHRGIRVSPPGTVLVPGLLDRARDGRIPGQPLEREDTGRPPWHLRRPGPVPRRSVAAVCSLPLSCARTSAPLDGGSTSVRHSPPVHPDRVGPRGHLRGPTDRPYGREGGGKCRRGGAREGLAGALTDTHDTVSAGTRPVDLHPEVPYLGIGAFTGIAGTLIRYRRFAT